MSRTSIPLMVLLIVSLGVDTRVAQGRARVVEAKNEEKSRLLIFPAGEQLGKLLFKINAKSEREKLVPALGRVEVPASARVMLEPSNYLLKNPEEIRKIVGTIDGITISGEEGKSVLVKVSGNKSLQSVRLRSLTIDARTISFLNSLTNLKTLILDDVKRGTAAAQIKGLKKLEAIRFADETVAAALPLLARSKPLEKIEIEAATLSDKDFEILQELPALRYLSIQNSQFSDQALATLPRFKTLKILWLGHRNWTPASIAPLKRMKNLKELHMLVNTDEWQLMREVHQDLPGVLVD